jgi:hypothetical protein
MSAPCLRTLTAALAIAVLTPLVTAGASNGAAETGSFQFQDQFSDIVDDSGTCLGPGATGTIEGTETVSGRFTENGPPAFGFHDHGTATSDFRVSYSDGRYILCHEVAHFNDNATHRDTFTSTGAIRDTGTLYSAAGQPLGPVTVQAVFHITYRDLNGNHQPDPGEVSASVEHFRLTCP